MTADIIDRELVQPAVLKFLKIPEFCQFFLKFVKNSLSGRGFQWNITLGYL